MNVLIFKNVWEKKPYVVSYEKVISRIKNGSSKPLLDKIRETSDKKKRNDLKLKLPCIRFSISKGGWTDNSAEQHSGYICLDFDNVEDTMDLKSEICCNKYVAACFNSPSNDGLKVIVKVPPVLEKHRGHFKALEQYFQLTSFDSKCVNPSRICYESYDPDIYINEDSVLFTEWVEEKPVEIKGAIGAKSSHDLFESLERWMLKKSSFVSGGRNHFIFTLACACKRNGIDIDTTKTLCFKYAESDFAYWEVKHAITSAYKKEQTSYIALNTNN
jgi:hypothetical protein